MGFFFSGLAAILSFKVPDSPFRYFAVVLGIVALVGFVLFMANIDLGLGLGGEAMIVYPGLVWYAGFGAHIMARRD